MALSMRETDLARKCVLQTEDKQPQDTLYASRETLYNGSYGNVKHLGHRGYKSPNRSENPPGCQKFITIELRSGELSFRTPSNRRSNGKLKRSSDRAMQPIGIT
ncbi:hatching enzyme-like protein [Anopheles sinensis]|uniref:Hatching enzyme-like protein n=1 Tax=Anopheles sinensis TaxID=74873 RepID=A0A084VZ41_ANOSI|nr:hatching enzyme-like protein [Anopheles sinensis]